MPKSVNVEVHDGDATSLMQAKQQVFKRANATDQSRAQPSTSKDDGDDEVSVYTSKDMCVSKYMVKAYHIPFRRYGANLVSLGCIGQKNTGYFYADFRCREQMNLWTVVPQKLTVAGPTKMTTEDASQFGSQVKAATAAASGSASASASSAGSGSYEFMSQEFSSEMETSEALQKSPRAIALLKRMGSGAKIVTGILVLSADSSSTLKQDLAGEVTATEATGRGEVSVKGSTSSTVGVNIPAGQTLAYELSEPEWDQNGKLVGLKKDPMCGRDDGWFGVCTTCGFDR